ncbi:TIGR01906 family membrane protein [Streptococcus infantis]|uniref:TIGR01906 family membrane protein n=1 Tax=Streptococcus infantis TaxID=68892 RepID=UPI0039C1FAF4
MKTKFTFVGSILFLLSLAILSTIYLAWLIYPQEISWLNLTSRVHFHPQIIQHNFNVLMDYLTNPLSQVLAMPDFPSSASGIHHFVVVKGLFHLAQGVAIVTLPIFYLFWKQVIQKGFLPLYRRALLIMLSLPLVLGLFGVLVGFEQFFTLFHQILFVGDDTWLFDPAFDPVILILPEEFFLHCFLLFFCIYELLFGFFCFKSRRVYQSEKE